LLASATTTRSGSAPMSASFPGAAPLTVFAASLLPAAKTASLVSPRGKAARRLGAEPMLRLRPRLSRAKPLPERLRAARVCREDLAARTAREELQ
jgi:hypothetical protein